jgi:hypothetical protein
MRCPIHLQLTLEQLSMDTFSLHCLAVDDKGNKLGGAFRLVVSRSTRISDLKDEIKAKTGTEHIGAHWLNLWKLSTPLQAVRGDKTAVKELLENFNRDAESVAESMNPLLEVCDYFKEEPARKSLHLIVQVPAEHQGRGKSNFLLELARQISILGHLLQRRNGLWIGTPSFGKWPKRDPLQELWS